MYKYCLIRPTRYTIILFPFNRHIVFLEDEVSVFAILYRWVRRVYNYNTIPRHSQAVFASGTPFVFEHVAPLGVAQLWLVCCCC